MIEVVENRELIGCITDEQWSILRQSVERAFVQGPVRVSSGRSVSPYLDGHAICSDPRVLVIAGRAIAATARAIGANYVVGEESSGLILSVSAVIQQASASKELKFLFIRKTPREPHGLLNQPALPGARVLIVDDIAGLGNAVSRTAMIVRAAQMGVSRALVIVDREDGARDRLAREGIDLRALVSCRRRTSTPQCRLAETF